MNRWQRLASSTSCFHVHALCCPCWAFLQHWMTMSPMNEWRFPINSSSALSCYKVVVSSHPQRSVLGFLLQPTHSKNKFFFHHVFTLLNHSQNQGACPGSAGRRYQNTPTRFPGGKEKHSFAPHLFWWCPAPPSGSSPPLLEPCSLLEVLLPSSLPLAVPHQLHGVSETEQRDCWLFIDVEMQNTPQKTKHHTDASAVGKNSTGALLCIRPSVRQQPVAPESICSSFHPEQPVPLPWTHYCPSLTDCVLHYSHMTEFTSIICVTHSSLETQCSHWQTPTLLFGIRCFFLNVLRLFLMILIKHHLLNDQNESTNMTRSSSGLGWLDLSTQAWHCDHLKKPKLVATVTTDSCSCPPPPDSSPLTSDGCCALELPAGWLAASAAAYGRFKHTQICISSASRGEKCHFSKLKHTNESLRHKMTLLAGVSRDRKELLTPPTYIHNGLSKRVTENPLTAQLSETTSMTRTHPSWACSVKCFPPKPEHPHNQTIWDQYIIIYI